MQKVRNPVAKHMRRFNTPAQHRDRKKDYSRKGKSKFKYDARFV